jgi:hypothetical protein
MEKVIHVSPKLLETFFVKFSRLCTIITKMLGLTEFQLVFPASNIFFQHIIGLLANFHPMSLSVFAGCTCTCCYGLVMCVVVS